MFPVNILKIKFVLPQPDGPTTAIKILSLVGIILFIIEDLVRYIQLNLTKSKSKLMFPHKLVKAQSISQCKELLASKLQTFEQKTQLPTVVMLSGYKISKLIFHYFAFRKEFLAQLDQLLLVPSQKKMCIK